MLTYEAVEKTSYRIQRVRAYGFYFWYVRDVRKLSFLCGKLWSSTLFTWRWPTTLFNKKWTKKEIMEWVPGFYATKAEARVALNDYLKEYGA
jgi:hypothetical protein